MSSVRIAAMSALATVVCLAGPTTLPLDAFFLSRAFPTMEDAFQAGPAVAVMFVLAVGWFLGGGALWGWALGRIAGHPGTRRLAVAGALGYGLTTIVVGTALGPLEEVAARTLRALPIHNLFTILFTVSTFLITGLTGIALGIAMRDQQAGIAFGWKAGLAAALGFAVVDVILDTFGVRVGSPNAAASATMLRVLAFSNLGAAATGGAVMGLLFARHIAGIPVKMTPGLQPA